MDLLGKSHVENGFLCKIDYSHYGLREICHLLNLD